jgi:hypothetical protein
MPITASKLLTGVAEASELDPTIIRGYWRYIREAGEVPVGRSGRRGREAEVDSSHAATLLAALLGSDSARQAPAALKQIRKFRGHRVFAPYMRAAHQTEKSIELTVSEVTISPDGGTFEAAIAAHIDLYRIPNSAIGDNFGPISVSSSRSESWGRIDIPGSKRAISAERFPGEPLYFSGMIFGGDWMDQPGPSNETPAYFSPGPFFRSSSVTNFVIARIAEALGPLDNDQIAQRGFPKFESFKYRADAPVTPLDQDGGSQ